MPVPVRVRELAEEVARSSGYDLVHIEYRREHGGWVLRLFIDQEAGISHQDCIAVSRELEAKLDQEDIIPHRYRLEISSPGIDRPISRPKDFRRFAGHMVKIKTTVPIAGAQHHTGLLRGVIDEDGGTCISLQVGEEEYRIPLQSIATARLQPEPVV